MATFLSDTFTDTDAVTLQSHTGETGATWTRVEDASDFEIQGNRLTDKTGGSGAPIYTASGTPASADYYVEGVFWQANGNPNDLAILGRVSATPDFYLWQYTTSGGGLWRMYKRVSGGWTEMGTYAQVLSDTTDYTGKLDMNGTAIKGYVDGTARVEPAADSSISGAGAAGIRIYTVNAGTLRLGSIVGVDTSTAGVAGPVLSGRVISGGRIIGGSTIAC